MQRSNRSGRIIHHRRDVSTRRPMHLTVHLRDDLPTLRTADIRERFRVLIAEARRRGLRTVAYVIMSNHIHWVVVAESREALRDATRYVLGQLARYLNKTWNRRGKVFRERYYSRTGRSALQAWNLIGYVLRNPHAAGLPEARHGLDPFLGVNEPLLERHPFLRTLFGPITPASRGILLRMTRAPVAYTPLRSRLQPTLPGLA